MNENTPPPLDRLAEEINRAIKGANPGRRSAERREWIAANCRKLRSESTSRSTLGSLRLSMRILNRRDEGLPLSPALLV